MASSRPQIWQVQNNALGGEVPEFRIDSYIQTRTLGDWILSATRMDREKWDWQLRKDLSFIHKRS